MYRNREMTDEVFAAVFAGDLEKAREALDLLVAIEPDGRLLALRNQTRPRVELHAPTEEFPKPGHLPGSTLGWPRLAPEAA
ncbi:hypothetical protein [Croceicoccus sp. BE223]|uniref:hypothetical protein n=1 Tax=Croceicoccus sp. BE223 TaxID=2817716 RepID=UPI002862005C|nr:hypothetical protein [Croceicoccus sp. BE223]MDR7101501.1 hypothetical protein [Croceicoccus sp. BE223]